MVKPEVDELLSLKKYQENPVSNFQSWEDQVFEISGHEKDIRIFVGENNITGSGKLPSGTYYYQIEWGSSKVTGYLKLKF